MAVDPMIARGVNPGEGILGAIALAERIKGSRQENELARMAMQMRQQQFQVGQEAIAAEQAKVQDAEEDRYLYSLIEQGDNQALFRAVEKASAKFPAVGQMFQQDPIKTREAILSSMRQQFGVPEAEKSPFGTVSPDKFTPDSLARFQRSGNYADLAPIERPQGSGSLSLPDGTHISFGTGGQPSYAPTKTGNATRSGLEKAFVDAQGNAMSLQSALQGWRPEFSTYAGQFKAAAGNVQEKAGITVDPSTRQYLTEYNTWRSNVSAALSQYLNQLSGAAISPAEEARLKASFPNDGDGPTEYYQKTLATMRRLSLVQARSAYLLSNPSVTLDSVSLDQMQNIMVAEANKLAAMYEQNGGLTPEQAKQKALQDTRARFGIGGQ